MPLEMHTVLTRRIEEVFARLGYEAGGGLIRAGDVLSGTTNRHIIIQAIATIGVNSVFGFVSNGPDGTSNFSPIVYIAIAEDAAEAKRIHRLTWSQGVVPILLIVTPFGLEVRPSLAPPPELPIVISWDRFSEASLPVELTSLTGVALCSSAVWRDFSIDHSSRVDKSLLDGIMQLSETIQLQEDNRLDRSVAHAVIGRFLYFYLLLDRNVIDGNWIAGLKAKNGHLLCPTIAASFLTSDNADTVWPAMEVWALFDQIDVVMNGSIFPVSKADRGGVSGDTLHLVHRVIRHGDKIGPAGRQVSFLDVSFATLRTETISAIYELFLSLESEDEKSDDGAFYTPPFLVDYVLDETDRILPFERSSRVLDPAAGSGIFLVGAYRRMLERTLPAGSWTSKQFQEARDLLERNVFGIERNPQAANVCRFSLYLTLLDYMSGLDIGALQRLAGMKQVFPALQANISSTDAFAVPVRGSKSIGRFTHVVGNPPWGSFGDSATRTNAKRSAERQEKITASMTPAVAFQETLEERHFPVSNKRLSELFIWKIKKDFLALGGALGILISTRSFVSRSAEVFPNAMATQFRLVGISNLSHFRYRLFAQARSPTIAIFARNEEADPLDHVWVYSPLLSSQPIGEKGHLWSIIVNPIEVETHRLRDLTCQAESWFDHLILRPLDRRYAKHIRTWNEHTQGSLGQFLKAIGLRMVRGGSPAQTGLPENLLLKAGNYREYLGLDGFGFSNYDHDALKRFSFPAPYDRIFGGNILLVPRSMNDILFVEEPIGFASTFNAICFNEPGHNKRNAPLLKAMANYLTSDVANYFFALVGRSWILDHARLEKNDLLTIPFPFTQPDEEAFAVLCSGDQKKITRLVAARLGLDSMFEGTVNEYHAFRSGYEDAQLPGSSLHRPGDRIVESYRKMFAEQLKQGFGSYSRLEISLDEEVENGLFARFVIRVRRKNEEQKISPIEALKVMQIVTGQFNPYSTLSYDPQIDAIVIVKPWTHVAWTMEQAFADARAVSATVLRSGTRA